MKRTLMAAVLGGLITLAGGAITAQAAPVTVTKPVEAGTSLVQTTGYGYRYRRHAHRPYWRHRPVVRWGHYRAPRRYGRPHYRYSRPYHRNWTHRTYRRHYR